jgi:hypothetical protein
MEMTVDIAEIQTREAEMCGYSEYEFGRECNEEITECSMCNSLGSLCVTHIDYLSRDQENDVEEIEACAMCISLGSLCMDHIEDEVKGSEKVLNEIKQLYLQLEFLSKSN